MLKKKNKLNYKKENNCGITLVALVVTIVILLILAGITITMLFGENGIIKKAQDAAEATKNGQEKDMQGLANLEEWITEATGEYAWKVSEDGTKVVNKNYPEGIAIGSYINYDCTPVDGAKTSYTSTAAKTGYSADQTFTVSDYKYSWRVLGADNKGQLLLIAEEVVPCTTADGSDNTWENNFGYVAPDRTVYFMNGKSEYANGIAELNAISDIYGHGEGATGGRSVNISDVDKLTKYNPNNEDGNTVTYYWDGTDKPYYETSNGLKGNSSTSHNSGFHWYDESAKEWKKSEKSTTATTEKKEKIVTLTSSTTYYDYAPSSIMDSTSVAYKMLFTNSSTGAYKEPSYEEEGVWYYLGSSAVVAFSDSATWGVGFVLEDGVYNPSSDAYSNGIEYGDAYGVRPVVSLKSSIKLTKRSDQRDECDFYDIAE